jgi:nucleoid-associated protein Lsr2
MPPTERGLNSGVLAETPDALVWNVSAETSGHPTPGMGAMPLDASTGWLAPCRGRTTTVDLVRCNEPITVREAGMAQKITVALEDDLDGGPADETVRFAIDGAAYEIDLSKKHAKAFRRKLAPFIDHARKAGRGRRRSGRSAATRERSGDIRA